MRIEGVVISCIRKCRHRYCGLLAAARLIVGRAQVCGCVLAAQRGYTLIGPG
jgi:hypothetical protein